MTERIVAIHRTWTDGETGIVYAEQTVELSKDESIEYTELIERKHRAQRDGDELAASEIRQQIKGLIKRLPFSKPEGW